MFANGSFPQTYYGPVTASGDLVRRLRSTGMSQAEFSGNQRAFQPKQMGIGAGSGVAQYRAGVAGDAARSQGYAEAMKPLSDYQQMVANANLQFQMGSADEQAGIRNLLLMQRGFNQDADVSLRGLRQDEELQGRQMAKERDIANRQRRAENKANTMNNIAKGLGVVAKFAL